MAATVSLTSAASLLWYRVPWEATVISRYVVEALHRAKYQLVDGNVYCATVPGLAGVISTGPTLESCRDQLAEVIEEWLLVRVARRLPIPRLGTVGVQVKKAS